MTELETVEHIYIKKSSSSFLYEKIYEKFLERI